MSRLSLERIHRIAARWLTSPIFLVTIPLLLFLVQRLAGEVGSLAAALGLALIVAVLHLGRTRSGAQRSSPKGVLADEAAITSYLDTLRETEPAAGTACLAMAPDGWDDLLRRMGSADFEALMTQLAARLSHTVRGDDLVAMLDRETVAIALAPGSRLSIETVIQTALRLQRCVQVPFETSKGPRVLSVSVGISLSTRMPDATAVELIGAARAGLAEALTAGPRAIRVNASGDIACPPSVLLARDLDNAFESGQIVPYFQPQISTDTGALTGVEALARWEHPQLGILSPGDFMPTIEAAQALPQLTDTMIEYALDALRSWDAAGISVPKVSINFTLTDLIDPALPERIAFALDRADIGADRLGIEVLETVLALQGDSNVETTLARLHTMGCQVDLDDFGTGNSSIANIRRFAIDRLKIDRSFVSGIDACRDKQAMVAAILTMADQLDLDVLAEGVETQDEHAMLSQLGCGYVQGYGLGRPMSGASFPAWVSRRRSKYGTPPLPEALRDTLIAPTPERPACARRQPGPGKTA